MSLSLITLFVVAANGIVAVTAAMLLLLVVWQAPRQRANQWFALTMVLFMSYAIANGFGRFIDDLGLHATTVMYVALWLYGLFTVSMFLFASEYAQIKTRLARAMRYAGVVIAILHTYLLWTDRLMINIRPTGTGDGSYQGDWTSWGMLAIVINIAYHISAAVLFWRMRDPRARAFWPAPAFVTLGMLASALIWPVLPIPLNAMFLAMAAVALGRPVLRYELFDPLVQANAELARRTMALHEASAMKNQFLTNMSYELRTPLSSIIGYTELVLSGVYGPLNDTQSDRLRKVTRNGHHLLALINDVLDLSKIESGGVVLNLRPCSTPGLLNSALATVEPLAQQKGLVIRRSFDGAPPVLADEIRARQIVTNLLSNAIKFTAEGSITVRAVDEGETVRLEVADTGIGIPQDLYDRVFLEFEQADSSSTRQYEGSGLGLAITRRLVELHGGEIWFQSTVGQGTTFFVRLPAAQQAALHQAISVSDAQP